LQRLLFQKLYFLDKNHFGEVKLGLATKTEKLWVVLLVHQEAALLIIHKVVAVVVLREVAIK
jgi:hypothetical protein